MDIQQDSRKRIINFYKVKVYNKSTGRLSLIAFVSANQLKQIKKEYKPVIYGIRYKKI